MDALTAIHIAGGAVGLGLGAVAIAAKKGSLLHKKAGWIFTAGMVVMAIPGGWLAYDVGKPFDVMSSLVALYMVLTGWRTFVQTPQREATAAIAVASLCIAGYLAVELYAIFFNVRATDAPPGAGYVFATILVLSLLGDFRFKQGAYQRRKLVVRHLWRMNFGLFMATASFFGARPHLFPDWMQSYGILALLTFIPLIVMAYWRFKFRSAATI